MVFFSHKAVEYARKVEENPAKAAAELFVKVNPDVELVSVDDQAGAMTFLSGRKEVERQNACRRLHRTQEGTHIFLSFDKSEDPKQP